MLEKATGHPMGLLLVERWLDSIGDVGDPAPAPPAGDANPLDRWAIEILDQLSSLGLAHRGSLVALPPARQSAVATTIVTKLMAEYRPGQAGDLDVYQTALVTALKRWFRHPYDPPTTAGPGPSGRGDSV